MVSIRKCRGISGVSGNLGNVVYVQTEHVISRDGLWGLSISHSTLVIPKRGNIRLLTTNYELFDLFTLVELTYK